MPRGPDLSHVAVRDAYLAQFPNTCYGLAEWRRYTDGIWVPLHELEIKREIQAVAEAQADHTSFQITSHTIDSVFRLLKARKYIPDDHFDAAEAIAFDDRLLLLPGREVVPHSPDRLLTSKLPFAYDPTARSAVWDQFLADTIPDAAEFLQEFAGLSLTGITDYETAIWLYGPPGGGKSTFIAGLQAMLGSKFCILGLSDIESSNFGLTQLPGKTAALSTEQPASFVKSGHLINAIVSGEPIPINRKYKDQITITPRAKLIWAMNELPRVNAEGLFRRIKVVHFPGIPIELRNPRVKNEIMESGMAIANWALEGLARLTERGHFLIPAAVDEATEYYRISNDPVLMFVDECCVTGDFRTPAKALYEAYKAWCKSTGHRPETQTRFGTDMNRLGYPDHKRSITYRLGLRLKEPGEDESNEILDDYSGES